LYTHIHQDHINQIHRALKSNSGIIVSEPTKDLLLALEGNHLLKRTNFKSLKWKKHYNYGNMKISLYPAKHILGSSQIILEDDMNIVYTGDFDESTDAVDSDILIIDATCGIFERDYNPIDIKEEFYYLVRRELKKEKPIYIYSRTGKIQDIMVELRKKDIDVPFITTKKQIDIIKVYEKYGNKIGNYMQVYEMEAWEIKNKKIPYISFYNLHTKRLSAERYFQIYANGVDAYFPLIMSKKDRFQIAISNHADKNTIFNYIQESCPKYVITDAYRSPYGAKKLATVIKRELKIEAISLPLSNITD